MCDLWQGFDPFVFGNCNENYAPNVCKWTGVSCDNCGTVTGFDLVDMSGTISPSLGELTALTSFVIKASPPLLGSSSPEVHGTLPPEIGSLSNLIKLDLGESSISGTIPMELSQLTSLTYLNLGTCKLGGPIPDIFYNLKNLSELYLDHNSFTGNVPPSVCALTELNTFYLDNNQLSCCPTCLLNAPNPGDTLPVADPNALIPGGGGATYGSKTGSLTNLAGKRLDPESSSSTCKGRK